MWGVVSPKTGPTISAIAPRTTMKKSAAPSARAGADPDPRGDQRDAGGEREHDRLEHELELGHAEVELGLEGREADQQAADRRTTRR